MNSDDQCFEDEQKTKVSDLGSKKSISPPVKSVLVVNAAADYGCGVVVIEGGSEKKGQQISFQSNVPSVAGPVAMLASNVAWNNIRFVLQEILWASQRVLMGERMKHIHAKKNQYEDGEICIASRVLMKGDFLRDFSSYILLIGSIVQLNYGPQQPCKNILHQIYNVMF